MKYYVWDTIDIDSEEFGYRWFEVSKEQMECAAKMGYKTKIEVS